MQGAVGVNGVNHQRSLRDVPVKISIYKIISSSSSSISVSSIFFSISISACGWFPKYSPECINYWLIHQWINLCRFILRWVILWHCEMDPSFCLSVFPPFFLSLISPCDNGRLHRLPCFISLSHPQLFQRWSGDSASFPPVIDFHFDGGDYCGPRSILVRRKWEIIDCFSELVAMATVATVATVPALAANPDGSYEFLQLLPSTSH